MENKIEIYRISEAEVALEVRFEQDSCWLTQQQMALLFEQTKQNISLHINNCFKEGELSSATSVKESLTVVADGRKYISNDALAAVTLFIAVSKPEEMQTVKQVVISMLNRKNPS